MRREIFGMENEILNDRGEDLSPCLKEVLLCNDYCIAQNNDHYIVFSGDKSVYINRWLHTSEPGNNSSVFCTEPFLRPRSKIQFVDGTKDLAAQYSGDSWYFPETAHIKGNPFKNRLEGFYPNAQERYVYGLSYVYCTEQQEILLHINNSHNPIPMRLWINGTLVFFGTQDYLVRRSDLVYTFNRGGNILLVERKINPKNKLRDRYLDTHFIVGLKPVKYLLERKQANGYFDPQYIDYSRDSCDIILEKAVCPQREQIRIIVLPRYYGNGVDKKVQLSLVNSRGEVVFTKQTEIFKVSDIPIQTERQEVLKILAGHPEDGARKTEAFVLQGDYADYCSYINSMAEAKRDCCDEAKHSIKRLLDIPDFKRGQVNQSVYPIDSFVYFDVLKSCWGIERYLHAATRTVEKDCFDISDSSRIVFYDSGVDGLLKAYGIYLPKAYDNKRKYPLLIQYIYSYGVYPIPGLNGQHMRDYLHRQDLGEAVVAMIPCIPEKYSFGEILIFIDMLGDIVSRFSIDMNRISIVGFCGTSTSCIRIVRHFPHVFSAIALIGPYIEAGLLNGELYGNTSNTVVMQLANVEKGLFMAGCHYADSFANMDFWCDYDFEHEEFSNCYNSIKLAQKITGLKKCPFPEKIDYKSSIPAFCRSYWISVVCVDDASEPVSIEAEIIGSMQIKIGVKNALAISIYIDKSNMGLDGNIGISINGTVKPVHIGDFQRIAVSIGDRDWQYDKADLSESEFDDEYSRFAYHADYLGIHRIYTGSYLLLADDYSYASKDDLVNNLYSLLDNASKVTCEKKQYKRIQRYAEVPEESLAKNHLIHVLHPRNMGSWKDEKLYTPELDASESGIAFGGRRFTGEYFALIKYKNPLNPDKLVLLAAYNSNGALLKLNNLLMKFDEEPIFFNDAIVYCAGEYWSYHGIWRKSGRME